MDELAEVSVRPEPAFARRAMAVLWSRRRFLLRFTLLGIVVSIVVAFLVPATYESTTKLMPPDTESVGKMGMLMQLVGGSGAGGVAADLLGAKSSGDILVEILQSRMLRDQLINSFDLRKVYSAKLMMDARFTLAQRTKIVQEKKSGVISLTVTDRDPVRAMRLAQTYVDQLDRSINTLNTSSAHRERVFLEERLKGVKQDLDTASRDLSQFASRNTALDPQQQGRAMVDAAARLQGEMIATESELKGLEQVYTPQNIRVRSGRARIAELQRQLDNLGGTAGSLQHRASGYPSIRELPLLGYTYTDLYRRVKIQEAVYETLTKQYELAKVEEAKELPSVSVLDRANLPERKSWPPRRLFVMVGVFLFLAAGSVWVVGQDYWQQLDPQDSRRQLVAEALAGLSVARQDLVGEGVRFNTMLGRLRRRNVPRASNSEDGDSSA
ncbi:MAG: lipopolysaccharide biosynthesis protein [Acidobacteriia bacterium]|nr:lipopolysaccharide biosynthesis protein [Terriglobia bacterium]